MKELMLIVWATLPVVVVGVLWRDPIEQLFESPRLATVALMATGLLLLATRWARRTPSTVRWTSALTMGLMQGVVNTFVIFLSRVVGHVVDRVVFKTERGYGPAYFLTTIVAQIFLSILASMIVMWFSRRREFRADAGGARLASRQKMINALRALQRAHEPEDLPGQLAAFGINGGRGRSLKSLFLSHPPLEERIAALESAGPGSEI